MIWHIARKEFTEITRDGRFLWTSMIIVILLIVSFAVGAQRYAGGPQPTREAAAAEGRQQWLSQGNKGPHTAAHYGVYAFKPATPLALFDPGYNDYTGTIQYLEAHKENMASYKPAADSTSLQRFGDLSGAMVLQMLVPLLIILLCFAMVSGEREDGTWRQLLSIGVPRGMLVAGKAGGVTMALGLVLVPALLIGGVIAALVTGANDPHDMIDFPGKIMVLAVAYSAFFAIFVCVSLSVSILARSSGAALTALIGFWIVAGLLIPRLSTDLGKRLYPTPSAFQIAKEIEIGRNNGPHAHEPNHPNHIAFKNKVFAQYHVQRVEDLPFNFIGLALQSDEENGYRVFDATLGRVRHSYDMQDRIQQGFALLSPFVAIKSLSAALSGTDVAFSNDFSEAGEAYRRNMVRTLNKDLMNNARGMSNYSAEWGYKASKGLWEQIPPFDFDAPPLGRIMGRGLVSLAILALWLVGSIALLLSVAKRARIDA